MIELNTLIECIIAGLFGYVAGFVVTRIMAWLKPGDWR